MAKHVEKKYRTTNWSAYNKVLKSRGSLSIWLDKEMAWFAGGSGKRGRSPMYSDAAIQFSLSMKCLFGLPLRQSIGLVESLLRLSELDWPVPDFSTVSRRQKHLQVAIRPSQRLAHSPSFQHEKMHAYGRNTLPALMPVTKS